MRTRVWIPSIHIKAVIPATIQQPGSLDKLRFSKKTYHNIEGGKRLRKMLDINFMYMHVFLHTVIHLNIFTHITATHKEKNN